MFMSTFLKRILFGDYSEVGLSNKKTRHDWIKETLRSIPSGESILDAGAGECQFAQNCSHLQYTAQDFSQYNGSGDGKGIQTGEWNTSRIDIVSDITDIPTKSGTFDNVLCTEVFEHVPDPVSAIKELVRVLKPGGRLIVTVPFASLTHFSPYHFASGLNVHFFTHWSNELGLDIEELKYNGNYFEFLAQEVIYSENVSRDYNGPSTPLKVKLAKRIFLAWLKKASKSASGSEELLAFGIHFVGRRRS